MTHRLHAAPHAPQALREPHDAGPRGDAPHVAARSLQSPAAWIRTTPIA